MKTIIKLLPLVVFLNGYFVANYFFNNEYAVLVYSALTALFVWAHVVWVGNKIWSALTVVLVFTLIFPLLVLFLIGNAAYDSWQETIRRLYETIMEHGSLSGLEFIFPILVAVMMAYLLKSYNNRPRNGTR